MLPRNQPLRLSARWAPLTACLFVVTAGTHAAEPAPTDLAEADVRDIGSRRQLFVDDYLIASMQNLKRSFHAAQKHPSPVMTPEFPWEGVGTAPWPSVYLFGDVVWDDTEKIYRMWYTSAPGVASLAGLKYVPPTFCVTA